MKAAILAMCAVILAIELGCWGFDSLQSHVKTETAQFRASVEANRGI